MAKRREPEPITVTVIYPSTPEGMAAFNRRMTEINSQLLALFLNKIDAPIEAKLKYVASLHGVVPWAKNKPDAQQATDSATIKQ